MNLSEGLRIEGLATHGFQPFVLRARGVALNFGVWPFQDRLGVLKGQESLQQCSLRVPTF